MAGFYIQVAHLGNSYFGQATLLFSDPIRAGFTVGYHLLNTVIIYTEPDHKRTLDNLGYFQAELNKNPDQYEKYVDDDYREDTTEEHDRYTELCRRPDFVVSPLYS